MLLIRIATTFVNSSSSIKFVFPEFIGRITDVNEDPTFEPMDPSYVIHGSQVVTIRDDFPSHVHSKLHINGRMLSTKGKYEFVKFLISQSDSLFFKPVADVLQETLSKLEDELNLIKKGCQSTPQCKPTNDNTIAIQLLKYAKEIVSTGINSDAANKIFMICHNNQNNIPLIKEVVSAASTSLPITNEVFSIIDKYDIPDKYLIAAKLSEYKYDKSFDVIASIIIDHLKQ